MITPTQEFLIKEICDIQTSSLESVFMEPNMIPEHEEILINYGATRKDYDAVILKSRTNFITLKDNPHALETLNSMELLIVLFILTHIQEEYGDKYPKAIKNLAERVNKIRELNLINN